MVWNMRRYQGLSIATALLAFAAPAGAFPITNCATFVLNPGVPEDAALPDTLDLIVAPSPTFDAFNCVIFADQGRYGVIVRDYLRLPDLRDEPLVFQYGENSFEIGSVTSESDVAQLAGCHALRDASGESTGETECYSALSGDAEVMIYQTYTDPDAVGVTSAHI
jgi:hypothetical protein